MGGWGSWAAVMPGSGGCAWPPQLCGREVGFSDFGGLHNLQPAACLSRSSCMLGSFAMTNCTAVSQIKERCHVHPHVHFPSLPHPPLPLTSPLTALTEATRSVPHGEGGRVRGLRWWWWRCVPRNTLVWPWCEEHNSAYDSFASVCCVSGGEAASRAGSPVPATKLAVGGKEEGAAKPASASASACCCVGC